MDVLEYIVRIRGAAASAAEVKGVAGAFNDLAVSERRAGESGAVMATGSGRGAAALTALKRATAGVGLALIGIGFEAVKASANFNHEMLRIRTDAGASTRELSNMKKGVLELASSGASMGAGPMSLAQGLYHLESLGIRGSKALKALALASQESAISGANLEQTTSALGAAIYVGIKGTGNLTQTMGILNATVGAGNMRFQDLVDALGTGVLASAKVAGLSITDVGAALAVLSDGGQNASSAAAQMATALHFLYAPTSKADTALKSIGLKSTSLAMDMHKPQGLLVALRDLHDHLKGLSQIDQARVLNAILPGGRGRVILSLIEQLDRLDGKYKQIGRTAHAFGPSVAQQRQDPQTQLKMQEAALQANLIRLGNMLQPILLPALNAILSAGSTVLQFFIALPGKISHAFNAFSKTSFGKTIIGVFEGIGKTAHQVFSGSFVRDLGTIGRKIVEFAGVVLKYMGPLIRGVIGTFGTVASGVFKVVGGVVRILAGLLTGDFSKAWRGVRQVIGAVAGVLLGVLKAGISIAIIPVLKVLAAAVGVVKDGLVALWNNVLKPVADFLVRVFAPAWTMVKGIFDVIVAPVTALWQMLQHVFGALGDIANWVAGAGGSVLNFFGSLNPFGGGNVTPTGPIAIPPSFSPNSPTPAPSASAPGRRNAGLARSSRAVTPVTSFHAAERIPNVTIKIGRHQFARISRQAIIDAMAAGA